MNNIKEIQEELEKALGPLENFVVDPKGKTILLIKAIIESKLANIYQRNLAKPDFFNFEVEETEPGIFSVFIGQNFSKYPIIATEYTELTGRVPTLDTIKRINCQDVGEVGHFLCGWCYKHQGPRFICGCRPPAPKKRII